MRFSTCLKVVQLSGFFWNQKMLPYNIKWCGWGYSTGPQNELRRLYKQYSDGSFSVGFVRHRPLLKLNLQCVGFFLLQYTTPFLSIVKPWSWNLLLNVKVRSNVAFRLKKGLPSHGQRTRSNHKTVKRVKDLAAVDLYEEGLASICGFGSSRKKSTIIKKPKQSKTGKSAGGKKKPPVRSAKKPNVWR